MGNVSPLLAPALGFVRENSYKIIIGAVLLSASVASFYLTVYTLKKLKLEIFSYYPFDRFFPQSGQWSILYFLVVVVLLGAIIYLLSRGGFYLAPA